MNTHRTNSTNSTIEISELEEPSILDLAARDLVSIVGGDGNPVTLDNVTGNTMRPLINGQAFGPALAAIGMNPLQAAASASVSTKKSQVQLIHQMENTLFPNSNPKPKP